MIRVAVVVALRDGQDVTEVTVPDDACVADAIGAARVAERHPGLRLEAAQWAILGKACALPSALRDGDRVELLRPLAADAKDQRRARVRTSSRRSRSGP